MPSKFQLVPKDIEERLKALPKRLAALDGLVALWLFGSFARGEATPVSDVDLAYLPDERLAEDALERFETLLYGAISRALHTDEFALVNLRRAPAFFTWQVLREGKLLLCRDKAAIAAVAEAVYRQAPDAYWFRHIGHADFLEAFGVPNPTVDKDRLIAFLRFISDDLQALREKAQVPKGVYTSSRDIQAIVERRLQTATESALNIGNHLIARLGLRAPQDYADVFRILGEARVLPWELAEEMMDMARFRNLLVHVYWEIDQARVYDGLPARLATLEAFAQTIARWLKEQG
jgi:uncharacterized protein YutE (UPF0331/DUF86 family)/predicted nucleotidyltransferase